MRRAANAVGLALAWAAVAWVAWETVRVVRGLVADDGAPAALVDPLAWLVLAQLVLAVLLLAWRPRPPLPRAWRALALGAGVVAGLCWLGLRARAPWAPWGGALLVLGLALPWLATRPLLRAATALVFVLGYGLVGLLGFTLGAGYAWYPIPGSAAGEATDRDGRWREDLAHLGRELRRLHGDAHHTLAREAYDARLADLAARVPELDDLELELEVARFVAAIGDAHTSSAPSSPGGRRLPLVFAWVGGDLALAYVPTDRSDLAGCRVLAFDGTPTAEVHALVEPLVSHENEPWLRHRSPSLLVRTDVLAALGVLDDPARATLTLLGPDGKERSEVIESVSADQPLSVMRVVTGAPLLASGEGDIWRAELEDLVLVRYSRCSWDLGLPGFARALFEHLDAAPDARLVVDLRGNTGGSSLPFEWWLLPGLEARAERLERAGLYVLVDGGTFSSGLGIAAQLERLPGATVVGEPTGGKPNSWGEVRVFRLPHSGLGVAYSTSFTERHADSDPPSLEPDVRIVPTVEDRLSQRDPVLEWLLEQR